MCKKCAAFGFDPAAVKDAVWEGTLAMAGNNGSLTNEDRFWQMFAARMGNDVLALKPELEKFYEEEFHAARAGTGKNPLAAQAVARLREKGYTVYLASNPMFPRCAYRSRLSWIDMAPEDFADLTSYENYHYCKPNPAYFEEIMARTGCRAQDCLMVGNDAEEDAAALQAGLDFYLVTDDLINRKNAELAQFKNGSFAEFLAWVEALPQAAPA